MSKLNCPVIAIASFGGHLVQLRMMLQKIPSEKIFWITTRSGNETKNRSYGSVPDCSRSTPFRIIVCFFKILSLFIRKRPKLIISTGATPGMLAIIAGKLLGAKTIWIDSLANSQKISLSMKLCKPFCDEALTQWSHLASEKDGIDYKGRLI